MPIDLRRLCVEGIEKLPADQQQRMRLKVADIVIDTFVYPADVDYINARFLSLNRQHRPFFWPALQAIEKYLKANLLFLGVSVQDRKKYGHNISSMTSELDAKEPVIKTLVLAPSEKHAELERLELWGSCDPLEFISSIEKYGAASNRYNYFGAEYEASYLPKLDQVVHALRTRCIGNERLCGTGRNKTFDYFAYEQNYPFAPADFEHGSFYGKFSLGFSVPTIEAALKGLYGHPHLFEKWLLKNIRISKEEISEIKNLGS